MALVAAGTGGTGAGGVEQGGRSQSPASSSAAGSMIKAAKSAATLARYAQSRASSRYSRDFSTREMRNVAPRSSTRIGALFVPGARNREIKCSRGTSVTSSCQMASGTGQRLSPTTGSGSPGKPGALVTLDDGSVGSSGCASSAACAGIGRASNIAAMTHDRWCQGAHTCARYPKVGSWIDSFCLSAAGAKQLIREAITPRAPYKS